MMMVLFGIMFAGCDLMGSDDDSGKDDENESSGVSFDNFATSSIIIDNNTSERLVAFKGDIRADTLISGIPSQAKNHGLKREPALFQTSGDFALCLITEEQYTQNKNNLEALRNTPFARMYAFYNAQGSNDTHYKISSKLGGSARLKLNNSTMYNIELRIDSTRGDVIGYVANETTNTFLYLEPGDYNIFPIFKKYVAADNEIYEVVPKYTDGNLAGKSYMKGVTLATSGEVQVWDLQEVMADQGFKLSSGTVYIKVTNNNSGTAIKVMNGDTPLETSTGVNGISSGKANVYSFKAEQNPDKSYPATHNIGTIKIGTDLQYHTIPAGTFNVDYIYTINVSGTNASNLAVGDIDAGTALDLEKMFDY
jgi:virulence-associated protein VapD